MTPADELRAAATKLRARLTAPELTPGPWLSLDHGDRLLYDGPGAEDEPPMYVVDEPMSNGANASYIAAMHPGVGAALADWLDRMAEATEQINDWTLGVVSTLMLDALAVARQINGTQQ